MKTAAVLRWGALGDAIMASPLYRLLKKDGYHVTAHVEPSGATILRNNPYIDEFIIHEVGSTPTDELQTYWDDLSTKYDKFVNLSGSIEQGLLAPHGTREFHLSKAERHQRYNHNYYDRTLEIAGFDQRGLNGELYFSRFEEKLVERQRKKYRDKFVILWSLSGSAHHKFYPWADMVGEQLKKYDDIMIITTGDATCCMLEWQGENVKNQSGTWGIRKTLVWAKYADLVIGTETGVLNGAACFDTPKIIMLSHSSEENLTKHWKKTQVLTAPVMCHPCHQIHYELSTCKTDKFTEGPVCMAYITPEKVRSAILDVYNKWKEGGVGYGRTSARLNS